MSRDTYERIIATTGWTGGLYESNYLKANAPDGSGAFWVKHNVLVPTAPGPPPVAEFWCVLWTAADGWRPAVRKHVVALDTVDLGRDRVSMAHEDVRLTSSRADGGFGDASWSLSIRDELPPLFHFRRDWMYTAGFPRKKAVTASPRAIFDGALTVGDRTVDVDGWVGHRQHNWGSEHAERYAYGGCNLWDDDHDLTVEGITVRVVLAAGIRSPWLTLVAGMRGAGQFGGLDLTGLVRATGEVEWPRWTAWNGRRGRERVRLEMTLAPEHAAGLRYLHPDGKLSYCYNAKDATVHLRLGDEVATSRAGELEFLFPEPVAGIPLHGHASLEELVADL